MAPLAMRIVNSYVGLLKSAPIRTQAASTAALWSLGDLLSQKFEGKRPLDIKRTLATAVYGGTFIGPFGHTWYLQLDRVAARYFRRGSGAFIGAKVAADTAIFGPLHIVAFLSYMTLWEGGTLQDVRRKLSKDFWPTMGVELTIWPALQAFNFWRVPVDYHLMVVNAATVFESTFFCSIAQQDDWSGALREKLKARFGKTAEAMAAATAAEERQGTPGGPAAGPGRG